MKKVVLVLLCVLLLVTGVGAEDYDIIWEGTGVVCGEGLSWSIDGGTLYITGSGDMYDFDTGTPWASYKSTITQVILSDTVTSVGAYAFQDYDALSYVYFGASLVSIGKDAFSSCDGLTSITLPATFKKFGENCFRSCSNLTTINCSGNFPRFDENCLWDTYCTIVYSASNPWSATLVQQLEEAFSNRIEFRSSDGTDPYVATEATQAATEAPTQETFWVNTPTAVSTEPAATQPTVPAATQATTPATTATAATAAATVAATQPTIVLSSEVTQPSTYSGSATDGSSVFGLLIVVLMLAILATGALLVRSSRDGGRKKKRKHRR